MALSRTDLAFSRVDTNNASNVDQFTTSSFTPPNNSLLVVLVTAMYNAADTMTISGGGLTYTLRREVSEDGYHAYAWTAPVTTGALMSITIDGAFTNLEAATYQVVAYTGYNTTTPVGSAGVAYSSQAFPGPGAWSFTPTVTLDAAPATDSVVIHLFQASHNDGSNITVASQPSDSGWTAINTGANLQLNGSYLIWSGSYSRTNSTDTSIPWGQFSGTFTNFDRTLYGVAIEIRAASSSGTLDISEGADTASQYVRTNGRLITNFLGQVANTSTLGTLTSIAILPNVLISPGSLIVAIASVYPYNANEPITLTSSASTLISFKLLSKNTSVGSMTTCIFYAVVPFTDAGSLSIYTLNIPNQCIFAGLQLFEFKRQNLVFPFLSRDVITNNSGDLLLTSWTPTVIANHSTKSERFVTVSGFIDSGGEPGAKLTVNAQTDQDNPGALKTIIFNSLSDNTLSFFMSTHTEWGTSQTTAGWDFVYDTVNFTIAADHLTAAYFEVQENTAKGGL